ncbi:MAG: hypothetical protein DMG31_00840 [Acidobacteria bacterium]|nr:MAG: hypothetical protein DMG31_00840 [Acidobacteriota bacterium]
MDRYHVIGHQRVPTFMQDRRDGRLSCSLLSEKCDDGSIHQYRAGVEDQESTLVKQDGQGGTHEQRSDHTFFDKRRRRDGYLTPFPDAEPHSPFPIEVHTVLKCPERESTGFPGAGE